MPQSRERKRAYMRGYMRRRRQERDILRKPGKSLLPPPEGSPKGTNNRKTRATYYKRAGVSPFSGRWFSYWDDVPLLALYPLGRRHLETYISYVNQQGYMLQVIDQETGEILDIRKRGVRVLYRLAPLAKDVATHILLEHHAELIAVQEQRIIQLEAGLVLHEAQEAYIPDRR